MHSIENDKIKITVANKGAELQSIIDKETGQEYMWSGDPEFWGKKSPVLFPIVGTLKNNAYHHQGKTYNLSRHGFARDMHFELHKKTENHLSFLLKNDAQTLRLFPFHFELYINYLIHNNTVSVTYSVVNMGEETMYFSIGGHPAFKLPIFDGDDYDDYILEFNHNENAGLWPITADGLLKKDPVNFFNNTNTIALTKKLFYKDALVFKHLQSNKVKCINKKNKGFEFDFTGFPYLGIWAANNADFICIEPWCGIADAEDTDQQLTTKEGINILPEKSTFEKTWRVTLL